jgi:hydroxymethylbilane synthase
MLDDRTDLAVHSAKDMPTEVPEGLAIVAFTAREDVRDVFVGAASSSPRTLDDLPRGATVGTSSLRRRSQLLALRPDLAIVDIRGNVQTRLRKLEEEGMAGTILAAAGLARLELPGLASFAFAFRQMLPAVGQGSLAVEARAGDARAAALVAPLIHERTALALRAERSLMHALQGGCQVPIAGYAEVSESPDEAGADRLLLRAFVGSIDGATVVRGELAGPSRAPEGLGISLAEDLLARGADRILAEVRGAV